MVLFYGDTLLRVGILAIYGENLRKNPTGHKLNQMVKCEGSLHKGKDENQYKVIDGMQCRMEIEIR